MVSPIIDAADMAVFRADAESLMTLTLTAYSPGGVTVVDNLEVPGFTPEGTTVGKVQGSSQAQSQPYTRTEVIGGVERPVLEGGLHIPLSAPIPERKWEYQVTAVGPADDPALLGRRYWVASVPAKSYMTARRLDVVEVPAP